VHRRAGQRRRAPAAGRDKALPDLLAGGARRRAGSGSGSHGYYARQRPYPAGAPIDVTTLLVNGKPSGEYDCAAGCPAEIGDTNGVDAGEFAYNGNNIELSNFGTVDASPDGASFLLFALYEDVPAGQSFKIGLTSPAFVGCTPRLVMFDGAPQGPVSFTQPSADTVVFWAKGPLPTDASVGFVALNMDCPIDVSAVRQAAVWPPRASVSHTRALLPTRARRLHVHVQGAAAPLASTTARRMRTDTLHGTCVCVCATVQLCNCATNHPTHAWALRGRSQHARAWPTATSVTGECVRGRAAARGKRRHPGACRT
jgi:hypothetical protein